LLEGCVVVEVVLVGAEAEGVAGGDVGGEVVDVEGLFGDEGVFVDGVLVDFWVRLDGIYLEGKDGTVEKGELGEVLKYLRTVNGIGVGEEDEAVALGCETAGGFPHGEIRGENVPPGGVELLRRGGAFHDLKSPVRVIAHGDEAGLELVFLHHELGKCADRIRVCGGEKGGESGFEIEVEKDFSDVE